MTETVDFKKRSTCGETWVNDSFDVSSNVDDYLTYWRVSKECVEEGCTEFLSGNELISGGMNRHRRRWQVTTPLELF